MKWKADLDQHLENVPVVLLANKFDALAEKGIPAPEKSMIDAACEKNGIYQWYFTSAKTGQNVDTAILALIAKIVSKLEPAAENEGDDDGRFKIGSTSDPAVPVEKEKKPFCCQ
eukprot:TRINITY_DN1834_c0_g2_i1.p1 TRINITY_DN1834_c0_g2~~TRINITY_DN1834_c0_g2_i1.p1  ORF type:complete len:114 (+),score=41.58 TRINITY_DN1834_c0_g2_i1:173-514(+)